VVLVLRSIKADYYITDMRCPDLGSVFAHKMKKGEKYDKKALVAVPVCIVSYYCVFYIFQGRKSQILGTG
jgi:hypothetical protein